MEQDGGAERGLACRGVVRLGSARVQHVSERARARAGRPVRVRVGAPQWQKRLPFMLIGCFGSFTSLLKHICGKAVGAWLLTTLSTASNAELLSVSHVTMGTAPSFL